jgi:hypothetical protein
MLPYQEDGKKLERLLEELFENGEEPVTEGILVIRKPRLPIPSKNCCSISYTDYDG